MKKFVKFEFSIYDPQQLRESVTGHAWLATVCSTGSDQRQRSYHRHHRRHISWNITKERFCGTWYLPHSQVHNDRTVPI